MVIDLVDSSDDEGQGTPPAKQGGSAKLPMHPASPPSHATTSSRDALAELLKGSTRPPLPPRGRASKPRAKSTAPKPAAGAEGKRRKADGEPNGGVGRTAGTAHPSGQPAHGSSEELWAVKHAPASEADMVVHKKKIEDVKAWLQPHASGTAVRGSKMVVVTGPPGCGKTATIHVLSQAMGFRVVEWQAQAQVSWDDVQYQRPDGVHYQGQDSVQYHSKLALFEDFASRAKVAALPLAIASRAPQEEELSSRAGAAALTNGAVTNPVMPALPPTLVLIDDLPYTSGIDQRQRLSQTLGDLARCARFPVVLIATEPSGRAQKERGNIGAAVSGPTGLHKVQAHLEVVHDIVLEAFYQ